MRSNDWSASSAEPNSYIEQRIPTTGIRPQPKRPYTAERIPNRGSARSLRDSHDETRSINRSASSAEPNPYIEERIPTTGVRSTA